MKNRILARMTVVVVAMMFAATAAMADSPKYIFFFLGDGMASAQIQATEAYLATKYAIDNGLTVGPNAGEVNAEYLLKPENRLNMSKMPVQGMQTTYDAFALQTDSASSATAFACGLKTRSGVIGMNDAKTVNFKSVAQLAHENGKKVGILTSVSLDHATPAAYYASVATRDYMNSIATQMTATGYEFFGGGGLASPAGPKKSGDTSNNIWDLLGANGYEVLNTRASILALKNQPRDFVVCINPYLPNSAAMPYAIDQPETNLSLAEMTEVAINTLFVGYRWPRYDSGQRVDGFFIMVEGGKIDWACHANDAMASIGDMIDFDNAVGKALAFYKKHPMDTLIIVTGDHETGGMTVGHATTGYKAYYDRLLGQKNSFEYFEANEWAEHKALYGDTYDHTLPNNLESNQEMLTLLNTVFGLTYSALNDYQKEKLEDAYDKSMSDNNNNSSAENTLLYGSYNPIIVTITHILNEQASVGWTSYSHTGVPVPVFAQGVEASRFAGFYDNTDIAKKLAEAMGISEALPIEK
ncbi:MAG: alkaline phosphatase [Pseudomonadota bacterium]